MLSSVVASRDSNTDADLKGLIDQGKRLVDEAQRREVYQKVHARMADQAEWLFVYAQAETFGKRANVEWDGVPTHGSLAINLFYLAKA